MSIFPTITARAHCDIPCGIYDPTPAKIAAKTVRRMIQQIEELELPNDWNDKREVLHYDNALARRIATKEEHAEACKNELEILWSDFFKEQHLDGFPELHETFWKAVKLCSQVKHDVDAEAAEELLTVTDTIAQKFYEAKGVSDRYASYKDVTDNLY